MLEPKAHRDPIRRQRQEARDLLIEAGRVLASSLDFETTVQAAIRLFIPVFADWGVIYLEDEDESVRVATVGHADPEQARFAQTMLTRYASTAALPRAPLRVMRTGQSEIVSDIDQMIREIAQDAEHLEALRGAGMMASISVPLTVRDRTFGAISFTSAESARLYGPEDVAFAEELGRRVATAIDNARLYAEAQAAIRARDDVLGIVAHDLRNPVGTISMAAQLLSEVELPTEQRRKQYGIIVRAADRMNSLIKPRLFTSARLGIGQAEKTHSASPAGAVGWKCDPPSLRTPTENTLWVSSNVVCFSRISIVASRWRRAASG